MTTTNSKRKRKVPWARRIISLVVLAALLAGLIFAGVKAFGWVMGILNEEHARVTDVSTPKPVEILPCAADDLNVTLAPSSAAVDEGIVSILACRLRIGVALTAAWRPLR